LLDLETQDKPLDFAGSNPSVDGFIDNGHGRQGATSHAVDTVNTEFSVIRSFAFPDPDLSLEIL
jgi:hypothetical protein